MPVSFSKSRQQLVHQARVAHAGGGAEHERALRVLRTRGRQRRDESGEQRGETCDPFHVSSSGGPKPIRPSSARSGLPAAEQSPQRCDGGAIPARRGDREVVVFGAQRTEAQPLGARDRLDRNAPVRALLRDRRRHRVVRARLVGETGGAPAREHLVDQHARAAAAVAVHHAQRRVVEQRGESRASRRRASRRPASARSRAAAASPSPRNGSL